LRELLQGDQHLLDGLRDHLRRALGLDEETVQSLLWEPPRSILLELAPTLARRLFAQWTATQRPDAGRSSSDIKAASGVHPLPDFLPTNLFSDLSLPEVTVALPPSGHDNQQTFDTLPVVAALRQLAPGRVTRRFAWERGSLSHWVPVPLDRDSHALTIGEFASEYEYVAEVPLMEGGRVERVPCFRPWTVALDRVPEDRVNVTSNAVLHWDSELIPPDEGLSFPVERTQGWQPQVQQVTFYMHAFRAPVTVRRYAGTATATVRLKRQDADHVVHTTFLDADGSRPAAVGVEQEVDGLCLRLQLPSAEEVLRRAEGSSDLRAWRAAYVRDRVLKDPQLSEEAGWFQRDWLYQVYVATLLALAAEDESSSLRDAGRRLVVEDAQPRFATTMDAIFRLSLDRDSDEGGPAPPTDAPSARGARGPARLRDQLQDLLARTSVKQRLAELMTELWSPNEATFGDWLQVHLHESLGEAVLMACLQVAPRHAAMDTLLLDLQRAPGTAIAGTGAAEIWITESTMGGAGVVDSLAHAYASDPRAFFQAIEAAVAPSDLETTSTSLDLFAELAVADTEVREALAALRQETSYSVRDRRRADLFRLLASRGLPISHGFSVGLHHRMLREGQDSTWDGEVARMLRAWQTLEQRFGIAIELRLFCYLATCTPEFRAAVERIVRAVTGIRPADSELMPALAGVLWGRASEMRARFFDGYSPFHERGFRDPSLVRYLLFPERVREVQLAMPDMLQRVQQALSEWGSVRLVAPRGDERLLQTAILHLIATPVDVDFLQLFPAVEGVRQDHESVGATLILRELG
jgi:hypothetical protein